MTDPDEIRWTFRPEGHMPDCGCRRMATATWNDDMVDIWNEETGDTISIPWSVIYELAERDGAL